MEEKKAPLLSVDDLTVQYITRDMGICCAVNHVSFDLNKGETIGLVGETGAGKTTIVLSILRLLAMPPAKIISGSIRFDGEELLELSESHMRDIRGYRISMIFQDPMTALNPIDCVGDQIAEVISLHNDVTKKEAYEKACEMMEVVGIPAARYGEYPFQFSGGMKQRIVIAMALACNPDLLIADEPTTALDVTIQAQVLEMMNDLKKKLGTSVILITHDLGIVAGMCDNVAVVYAGEVVEYGPLRAVYKNTQHPYTKGLFGALPSLASSTKRITPIEGLVPDPSNLPKGCKFAPRCKHRTEACEASHPGFTQVGENHFVRCILAQKEG